MVGRAFGRAFATAVIAAVTACSLTSLEGFSGAPAPAEAGSGSFCGGRVPAPFACADFEDGTIPSTWSVEAAGGTQVAVDDQGSASRRSLRLAVPADGSPSKACVTFAVPNAKSSFAFEADIRLDAIGTADFDVLTIVNDGSGAHLGVSAEGSVFRIEEDIVTDGSRQEEFTRLTQALGASYRRLRFVATTADSMVKTRVFVDDVMVGGRDAAAAVLDGGKLTIELGDCAVGGRGWLVHVDNVVVEAS